MRVLAFLLLSPLVMHLVALAARADEKNYTRVEDVIYGRKYGMALTLDVFTPKEGANGLGVIAVMSGAWYSDHAFINPDVFQDLLKRGYTVFPVVHGSNPKFTIPEAISDMHRSVRFIRKHAAEYKVDPERLGIWGASAGGHLSLMQGTAGTEGKADAMDEVERESSRVQAVVAFFPPTDFLNYGKEGTVALGTDVLARFPAPFAFTEFNAPADRVDPVTDPEKVLQIGREISPITHVSADDPPVLLIHGDADKLVPYQQSEILVAKLKEAGVAVELVTKPGAEHGWPDIAQDFTRIGDWFDRHLKEEK